MNALILHSIDGQEYAHVVLYPATWSVDRADALAIEAFEAAQRANPDEWSWDDNIEDELTKRGFVVPLWHHGPVWDIERLDPTCEIGRASQASARPNTLDVQKTSVTTRSHR